jgi:hypothetical protein
VWSGCSGGSGRATQRKAPTDGFGVTSSLRRCPLVRMGLMPRVNRLMNRQWTTRDETRGCMWGARLRR